MRLLFILFFIIIKNSYSINWTKEFNGISSSEKINLSNGGTISHYKNFGNWKDSLGNYGTQKLLIDFNFLLKRLKIGKCLRRYGPRQELFCTRIF